MQVDTLPAQGIDSFCGSAVKMGDPGSHVCGDMECEA